MATAAAEIPAAEGWRASLRLGFRPGAKGTVLADRRRQGPLAVQRAFYPEGGVCHTYLLHPPGGVVGGDRLNIEACLEAGADIIVNTDGDNQYCAEDIPKLIEPILDGRAEMVIGARPIADIEDFSALKKYLQRIGSWVVRLASKADIPAVKTKVVDRTGAGDALTAGVVFGLVNGFPIDEAVRLGATAAALTLRHEQSVCPELSLDCLYNGPDI